MSKLAEIIAKEIGPEGIIPFARFMELALYCPEYGFYEKERDIIGARGHFITSPSVGPLFGQLLAFQFAQWFDEAGQGRGSSRRDEAQLQMQENQSLLTSAATATALISPFSLQLVEAGAHDGRLASDILAWFRDHRPDLFSRLEYCILEPSLRRRQWQQETLASFVDHTCWITSLADLTTPPDANRPAPCAFRLVFSNELLDAMPVHRLAWDSTANIWFEWGVTFNAGRFEWSRMPKDSPEPRVQSPESHSAVHASRITHHVLSPTLQPGNSSTLQLFAPHLPDGFILDICPAAEQWWADAARSITAGKLLTIDYGLTGEELLAPHRTDGTLRAYHQHQLRADLLANPGEQDLTAHVNFTALQAAGESAGLTTDAFLTQEQFLTRILEQIVNSKASFPPWTSTQKRQFQTLTHPDFLGRPFRVLVQSQD